MKKSLLALLFLFAGIPVAAQTTTLLASGGIGLSCNAITTATSINPGLAGGCTAFALVTSGNSLPSIVTWQVITTGTPASIAVNLMGSLDGVTWSQADTTSAAGTRTVTSVAYRYLGCVPATLTGGSSPTITCQISVAMSGVSTTGTVSANNGIANALARYVSAGGSVTVSPSATASENGTTLALGINGTAAGKLTLNGATSGGATLTAPAVAGTVTNPVVSSNAFSVPAGAAATPSLLVGTTAGLWQRSGGLIDFTAGSNAVFEMAFTGGTTGVLYGTSASIFAFTSGAVSAATDIGISRDAAGVLDVGNGTAANTTGKVKASGYISVGTKFTTNAGCSEVTTAGGATAGRITTVGSTSCTTVVTMGDSATAPNGWQCSATDITTAGDAANPHMTTSNATTATIVTGTIVSGDVISFACIGY